LGICLIVLALLEAGTIIVSQFWWGFIGVGLVLIAGLLLLAGSFIAKPIVYRLFFVVCVSFLHFHISLILPNKLKMFRSLRSSQILPFSSMPS
jgi:hypothetical protein